MASSTAAAISAGFVKPNELSKTTVSCGIYSLSNRCNVPFVELVGTSGFRKIITWGEMARVPAGQQCTIANVSAHAGDIFLNQGEDVCNRPARICVPVTFSESVIPSLDGNLQLWQPDYPCDVRGARRAYLMVDAYSLGYNDDPISFFVRGKRLDGQGSHNTESSITSFDSPFGPGVGYLNFFSFAINQEISYIPLGCNASGGDDTRPHCLLDAADAFMSLTTISIVGLDDLLNWPADAQDFDAFGLTYQKTDAPGTWYVIEY